MPRPKEIKVLNRKVPAHILRYVEAETRLFNSYIEQINQKRVSAALERPPSDLAQGGGRGNQVSDPPFAAVNRLEHDPDYQAAVRRVERLKAGLNALSDLERQVIDLMYLRQEMNITEVSDRVSRSEKQARRLKHSALYKIAVAMDQG